MRAPARISWLAWSGIVALALVLLALEWHWLGREKQPPAEPLPVLATTPDFSFTSGAGETVSRADLAGKIWIADFIFTRCGGPCPRMTEKMRQLQDASRHLDGGNVRLVSVTVDPEYDTPAVLSKYAARAGANPDQWLFLTGDPAKIENFIVKGMLLGLSRDGEGLPVHSQKFVVVDRAGNIRAYHDLDDPSLVPAILNDIETLSRERRNPDIQP